MTGEKKEESKHDLAESFSPRRLNNKRAHSDVDPSLLCLLLCSCADRLSFSYRR